MRPMRRQTADQTSPSLMPCLCIYEVGKGAEAVSPITQLWVQQPGNGLAPLYVTPICSFLGPRDP